jgi:hypothetical protein
VTFASSADGDSDGTPPERRGGLAVAPPFHLNRVNCPQRHTGATDPVVPTPGSQALCAVSIPAVLRCVGYQAHGPKGHEDASLTLNGLIDSVRFTGDIGVVGVFLPEDPAVPRPRGSWRRRARSRSTSA